MVGLPVGFSHSVGCLFYGLVYRLDRRSFGLSQSDDCLFNGRSDGWLVGQVVSVSLTTVCTMVGQSVGQTASWSNFDGWLLNGLFGCPFQ